LPSVKAADVAFVVNTQNTVQDLSAGELKDIFSGRKMKWPDGTKIVLVAPGDGSPERIAGLKFLYGMTESEFFSHSTQAAFSGHASAIPHKCASSSEAVATVSSTPGAIAFVVSTAVTKGVKVIQVDSLKPGEEGYRPRTK